MLAKTSSNTKIDNQAVDGLLGVKDSLAYKIHEIEKHLHNREFWFGANTAPSGVASNFREMLVQTWRRFFKKTVKNDNTSTIKTYADNETTVTTTQTISDVSDVETQGPAT